MKEIIIRIPEDSTELLTELVERLGGSIDKKERIKVTRKQTIRKGSKNQVIKSPQTKKKGINTLKKKGDPLALFGKYPDFPLDPKTYRKDLWKRKVKL